MLVQKPAAPRAYFWFGAQYETSTPPPRFRLVFGKASPPPPGERWPQHVSSVTSRWLYEWRPRALNLERLTHPAVPPPPPRNHRLRAVRAEASRSEPGPNGSLIPPPPPETTGFGLYERRPRALNLERLTHPAVPPPPPPETTGFGLYERRPRALNLVRTAHSSRRPAAAPRNHRLRLRLWGGGAGVETACVHQPFYSVWHERDGGEVRGGRCGPRPGW